MKNKKSKNNNIIKIIIGIVVVGLVIVGVCLLSNKDKAIADVEGTIEESIWLEAKQTLAVYDGDNTLVLTIDSDLDFDKTAESYSYEVPYTLKVNDAEYNGNHTFSKGYSIHSEDNDMPYQVGILDFENGKIQVVIRNK